MFDLCLYKYDFVKGMKFGIYKGEPVFFYL